MGENTVGETGYDFFISFAEDAKEWVYGVLVPKLGRTGKRFVLETPEINGQFKLKSLQTYIENSQTILLILSPQYLTSERKELIKQMALLRVAEQSQWQVIPILLKSVERELVLRLIDGIDLTKGYEHEERLDALLASGAPTPEEAANLAIPPYPGMVTFKEEDASRFFGRDDEIDEYVKTLRNQQLLVLTGASGCGKSSLARAGIIPQLKAKHQFLVKSFRPSDANLASWLAELEHLLATNLELARAFLWQGQTQAQYFLLLIDQFEELFALETSERPAFTLSESASHLLRVLKKLRQQIPEFYLLVTVRAEFFPQLALCQPYIDFDKYLQRVNALGRKGLTAAITQPALKKGVFIDERLVERLVNDAGDDPGILPFVQETLRDLWERRYERYIGLEAYEHLGGKAGSGLKASIAAKADAAYKSLTAIDKNHAIEKSNITKRIFLRLIQFGEGKPDTRRQQSIAALRSDQDTSGVFEETLRHLSSEKYRLLTVNREENDEDSKVDIVHEALIKAWPMLQEWIKDFRNFERKRRVFDIQVREWINLGEGGDGLLDIRQISELESTIMKEKSLAWISDDGIRFLKESKKQAKPKWTYKSYILLLLLAISFFSFNVYLFKWFLSIKSISFFYYYLIFMFLLVLLVISTKGEKYRLQKTINHISNNKIRLYIVTLLSISMLVVSFKSYFYDTYDEIYCANFGINTIPTGSGSNYDNYLIDDSYVDKESISVFSKVIIDTEIASSKNNFSYLRDIKSNRCFKFFSKKISFSLNKNNIDLKIEDLKSNKIYYLFSRDGLKKCSAFLDLAYKVLLTLDSSYKSYPIHIYNASCRAISFNDQCVKNNSKIDCLEAIKDSPTFLNSYVNLSNIYLKEGDYSSSLNFALAAFEASDGNDHIIIAQLAKSYLYMSKYDLAKKYFLLSQKINPHPYYLIQLSIALRELNCINCLESSLAYLKEAEIGIDSFSRYNYSKYMARILKNKAIVYSLQKENKKSILEFKNIYSNYLENFEMDKEEIYYYLAVNFINSNRYMRGCNLLIKRSYLNSKVELNFEIRDIKSIEMIKSYCQ